MLTPVNEDGTTPSGRAAEVDVLEHSEAVAA